MSLDGCRPGHVVKYDDRLLLSLAISSKVGPSSGRSILSRISAGRVRFVKPGGVQVIDLPAVRKRQLAVPVFIPEPGRNQILFIVPSCIKGQQQRAESKGDTTLRPLLSALYFMPYASYPTMIAITLLGRACL